MLKSATFYLLSHTRQIGRFLFTIALAFGIAAAAIAVALRFWVMPDIEKYHNEITALASRAVGLPVKIGKIEADWQGLNPHLRLTEVRLLDAQGGNAFTLHQVDNVVSWMTLFSSELRLASLEVDAPDLVIRRDAQGLLYVAGLKVSGKSEDDTLSDWMLHQSSIIVRNGRLTWQDELYGRPSLVLEQVQLRVENRWWHHRLFVDITPPPSLAAPVTLTADLVGGSFSRPQEWHGEASVKIQGADVGAWKTWLEMPDEFSFAKGGLLTQVVIEKGRISQVTVDLDMREVQSRLAAELPLLDLTRLQGRVSAHLLERSLAVSSEKLSLQMRNGFELRPTDFYLRMSGAGSDRLEAGEIRADAINLPDIAMLAQYLPMPTAYRHRLTELAPRGRIANLKAEWWRGEDIRFNLNADFEAVSVTRSGDIPGVEGLSGQVEGNDSSGTLSLNAPGLKLDVPQLFLAPISFDTFSAQLGWQRKRGGWDVKLNNFSAENADAAGTAYGHYLSEVNGLGSVDVTLNLSHASVHRVPYYLPKELLGNETMSWLQSGLVAGIADKAQLRLRGELKDFPFADNKNGIFQVKAKAKGVVIDYFKGWPRVEDAAVTLAIDGQRLLVDSTSAKLAGATAQRVSVVIPDLVSADPLLQISGEVSGETRHGLNFIKQSPVREYIGGFTDDATARGNGKLSLQLDIPLSDKPIKVKGNYHFVDNEIFLDEAIPLARKVNGDLGFTESSLFSQGITAQALGGPTTVSIATHADGTLKVKMRGRVDADAWRKVNTAPALLAVHGMADWTGEVSVLGDHFSVLVDSDLKGISADLPAPFTKQAQEKVPIKFELRSAGAAQDVMWLQHGNLLSARLVRMDDRQGVRHIKRGYVNLGTMRRIPDREGVWVTGSLPLLSMEGWSELLPENGGEAALPFEIDGMDVSIEKLIGYDTVVDDLNIHARNRKGTISAQLNSKQLNGDVMWIPQGNGKLIARLKTATYGNEPKAATTETVDSSVRRAHGSDVTIPILDIAIEDFIYKSNSLGKLDLHASQFEKDILLNHLRLSNPDGMLEVNGKWGLAPAQTHLAAKLTLKDMGNMLDRSGYPNSVRKGSGTLECDLVWPGAPQDMTLSKMDGHVSLNMAKGQFLKQDPGVGRLLSVMSLQSLPKRITLDFNDVFSKGFEFDSMDGVAKLKQGVLQADDFKIYGSAALVTMSGQVDLVRETQNLRVKVFPSVGDSVSLLAFAAGPAVGAGVYLANKILRDPLDKLVSFEYNVTGNWVDPKVEKVGQNKTKPK